MSDSILHGLMPVPAHVVAGDGALPLDNEFCYRITGAGSDRECVVAAARRFVRLLRSRAGLEVRLEPVGGKATLRIHCAERGEEYPTLADDESYELIVDADRGIELVAPNPIGVVRGLATLAQLLREGSRGFAVATARIEDRPRFPWRGLLIDVSRHFIPEYVIKRNLDAMAALKLNVLHWHLTDDQGFRVESERFRELHERGGEYVYYTKAQISSIVAYAAERGIRVVPEFDMPGHASSWLVAYPHLGCGEQLHDLARNWGPHDACLNPVDERVYEFLEGFFGEILPLFPDEYVHIGGDEVNGVMWGADTDVRAYMREQGMGHHRELQAVFNARVKAILSRLGKRMMGWDEMAHPDLGDDVLLQCWRGPESLAEVARKGHDCIQSHGYYLDQLQSAGTHYAADPLDGLAEAGGAEQSRVLGGEACMWTEYVDDQSIDSRIWPRAAAIAERLWSSVVVDDVDDMYRRLQVVSRQLEGLGLTHVSRYHAKLAELANGRRIETLQILTDVLAPTRRGADDPPRAANRHTRLDRLMDVIPPESALARRLAGAISDFSQDSRGRQSARRLIQRLCGVWSDNHARFGQDYAGVEIHTELQPLSSALAALAQNGLAAMDCLVQGVAPPRHWVEAVTRPVDPLMTALDGLELQVVESIERLLAAAISLRR